jgi:hypothetical protein
MGEKVREKERERSRLQVGRVLRVQGVLLVKKSSWNETKGSKTSKSLEF